MTNKQDSKQQSRPQQNQGGAQRGAMGDQGKTASGSRDQDRQAVDRDQKNRDNNRKQP